MGNTKSLRRAAPTEASVDIRHDPRWGHGYLDRFAHHEKLPIVEGTDLIDSFKVILEWFDDSTSWFVLDSNASLATDEPDATLIVSGRRYANGNLPTGRVRSVLLEHEPELLSGIAREYQRSKERPLLLHPYLPRHLKLAFTEHELPRATPILPLLIRTGIYRHQSSQPQVFTSSRKCWPPHFT